MRIPLGLIIGGVAVVVAAGVGIASCSGGEDDENAAAAPASPPPAKIRVELLKVMSTATEDLGHDEFYVVGGASLPETQFAPAAAWGNVAPPVDIAEDGAWHDFDQGRVFFDGPAAGVEAVHISAVAYDEDSDGRDWSDTAQLTSAIGGRLAKVNGKVGTGGKAVSAAGDIAMIVEGIRSFDADDQLGQYDIDIPVRGQETEILTWKIDHDAGFLGSSYHYEVQLKITRYV
ncbi:hypothetical protein AB0B66_33975 [Catellatospora sp. NPDC049111]|uniref:hypothetical protein n=1 Tax=Catellatospora sp. NPDC049111 TaxID=3155271 RepID=UPI003411EFBD